MKTQGVAQRCFQTRLSKRAESCGPVTKIVERWRVISFIKFCLCRDSCPGLPISGDGGFPPDIRRAALTGVSSPTFREKRRSVCLSWSFYFSVFFRFTCSIVSDFHETVTEEKHPVHHQPPEALLKLMSAQDNPCQMACFLAAYSPPFKTQSLEQKIKANTKANS